MDGKKDTGQDKLSSTRGTRDIKCPFFRQHSSKQIHCEGVMEGCTNAIIFREEKGKSFYQHTYCERNFDKCEHYRVMMREIYQDE